MRQATQTGVASLAILALCVPTVLAQQIYSESRTQVYIFDNADTIDVEYENAFLTDDLPYLLTATRHSGSVTNGGGTSQAGSGVGIGYIRANSGYNGFINNFGNMSSRTDSWFEDELLFTSNTMPNGTPGTVTIPLSILHAQGITNGQPDCSAAWVFIGATISVRLDGSVVENHSMFTQFDWIDGQPEVVQTGSIPASINILVNYVIGTPVTLRVRVTTTADINSDGCAINGAGFAELPNSLRSLGIQDLPPDVMVTGSIDWTKPAPIVPDKSCPADINGDGELNFFDVAAFVQLFQDQDPAADFNNDGLFNFFDFSDFLADFNAGCP